MQWARQHDGILRPRELAKHLDECHSPTDETGPVRTLNSLAASLTNAAERSQAFSKINRGTYQLDEARLSDSQLPRKSTLPVADPSGTSTQMQPEDGTPTHPAMTEAPAIETSSPNAQGLGAPLE